MADANTEQAMPKQTPILDLAQLIESKQPRIIVGVPAYNEEQFIGEIVRKASVFADEVIVVDDGSTDNTYQVAEAAGALVIRHEVNIGVGAATRICFDEARRLNADVLVTLDGDGQHDPDEIAQVAIPCLVGRADLVIGSRFKANHGSMPAHRKFGIKTITWMCNLGSNVKTGDAQSCFRAYGRKAIHSLNCKEQGFSFSVDLLIQSRECGLNITEVPISCIYHANCHTANPVIHGLGVSLAVIELRLKSTFLAITNTIFRSKASIPSEPDTTETTRASTSVGQ